MIRFMLRIPGSLRPRALRVGAVIALCAILGAILGAPTWARAYQTRGDRALLIGVNAYEGANALTAPVTDVQAMRRLLTTHMGFQDSQILVLTDHQATRAGVLSSMRDWLVNGTNAGDRVFFYYSGHGFQQEDEDGDEGDDGLDETLVPIDHRSAGMILDDEIGAILDMVGDRRVTAIFDSCHSGTAARSGVFSASQERPQAKARMWSPRGVRSRNSLQDVTFFLEQTANEPPAAPDALIDMTPRRVIWTAASSNELAFESTKGGDHYGVFTRAFIEAVENAGGQAPTRREVMRHVTARSAAFCAQLAGCLSLTPTLEASSSQRSAAVGWAPTEVRDIVVRPSPAAANAPVRPTIISPATSVTVAPIVSPPAASPSAAVVDLSNGPQAIRPQQAQAPAATQRPPSSPSVQPPASQRPPSPAAVASSSPPPRPTPSQRPYEPPSPVSAVSAPPPPQPPVVVASMQRPQPTQPAARPPRTPPFAPRAGAIDQGLLQLAGRAPRRLGASIVADDPVYGPPRPGEDLFNISVRGDQTGRVIALWSDGRRMVQLLPRFDDRYLRRPSVTRGGGAVFPDPRSSGWRLPSTGVIFVGVVSNASAAERFVGGQGPRIANPEDYLKRLWSALSNESVWSARAFVIGASR